MTASIEASSDMRPSTRESYENVGKRLPDASRDQDVQHLSTHDLDAFFASLRSQGYAAATVRQTHAVLRAALAQAVRWRWIPTNPGATTRPLRASRLEKRTATPSAVYQLVVGADAKGDIVLATAVRYWR